MSIRLVLATQDGIITDRDDISIVRLGHGGGIRIFEHTDAPCSELYHSCGLEWRAIGGAVGEIAGREMLVQMTEDGVLAVACIHPEGGGVAADEVLVLSQDMELGTERLERRMPRDEHPDTTAIQPRVTWWRSIFSRKPKPLRIFSVRDHLPLEFLPIR